jgi:glycosyltransferase involved in cell wall biosynthesis
MTVSVIVPVLNEKGMIREIFRRVPRIYELIFVDGRSTDGTYEEIIAQTMKPENFRRLIQVFHQKTSGKAEAVMEGFNAARGDVLVILDGDLTVDPEYLPMVVAPVGQGVMVIGSRLLEMNPANNTMRLLNIIANRFFARALSRICRRRIADCLCGTKALTKADWLKMKPWPQDPYGDFSVIFEASRLGMLIANVPLVYHPRVYGKTKIKRWRQGWLLLKMTCVAFWRLRIRHGK